MKELEEVKKENSNSGDDHINVDELKKSKKREEKGDWINIDGKMIKGTVIHKNTSFQDFVSLVSGFVNELKEKCCR